MPTLIFPKKTHKNLRKREEEYEGALSSNREALSSQARILQL